MRKTPKSYIAKKKKVKLSHSQKRGKEIEGLQESCHQLSNRSNKVPNQTKNLSKLMRSHLLFEHTEQLEVVKLVILQLRFCIHVQIPLNYTSDGTLFRKKSRLSQYSSIQCPLVHVAVKSVSWCKHLTICLEAF